MDFRHVTVKLTSRKTNEKDIPGRTRSPDQFWTFRPSQPGCQLGETSLFGEGGGGGGGGGGWEVDAGWNQRAETYCFNLKRS